MNFTIEVLLRENHTVFSEVLSHEGHEPSDWNDEDVRQVMTAILGSIGQLKDPRDESGLTISLRGVSWIVQPAPGGVVIAVDIPSGQAVAGPFQMDAGVLDGMLRRVMSDGPDPASVH